MKFTHHQYKNRMNQLEELLCDLKEVSHCPVGMPLEQWCGAMANKLIGVDEWWDDDFDIPSLMEIARHAKACKEINDSGEEYSHPNADGAQCLANLFSAVEDVNKV